MHIRPYEIKLFAIIALLHYGFFFIPLKHLVSINASKCIYIFDQNKLLIVEMFILCLFIIVIFFSLISAPNVTICSVSKQFFNVD